MRWEKRHFLRKSRPEKTVNVDFDDDLMSKCIYYWCMWSREMQISPLIGELITANKTQPIRLSKNTFVVGQSHSNAIEVWMWSRYDVTNLQELCNTMYIEGNAISVLFLQSNELNFPR